jgi:hypothetical protein
METAAVPAVEAAPALTPHPLPAARRWRLGARIAFRFGFAYAMLFCLPILAAHIPGLAWIAMRYREGVVRLAVWSGHHLLGIDGVISTAQNGSGDRTIDYLCCLCAAGLALLVTLVWSIAQRERREHARLLGVLPVVIRYSLAAVMFGYGIVKLFGGQFPPPSASRLLQPYGDSSPMGLLWTFMGASRAYVFFAGAGETVGAALLLFRRTSTLGALLLTGVLGNVVMMNLCYDVAVKLYSLHYLAMCVVLLLLDRRLAGVLLLNRATDPTPDPPAPPRRWMRIALPIAKGALILMLVVPNAIESYTMTRTNLRPPITWYDGFWQVERFTRAGQEVPPVITDGSRWKRIKFETAEGKSYFRARHMDDSYGALYRVTVDEASSTLSFTPEIVPGGSREPPALPAHALGYTRPDPDHLTFEGRLGPDDIAVTLSRFQPAKSLLTSRGFRWISEAPFNR